MFILDDIAEHDVAANQARRDHSTGIEQVHFLRCAPRQAFTDLVRGLESERSQHKNKNRLSRGATVFQCTVEPLLELARCIRQFSA
jgi:hypothetical protein